jgi:hypothetical protein
VQKTCKPALIYLQLPTATCSPTLPVVSEWYQRVTGDEWSALRVGARKAPAVESKIWHSSDVHTQLMWAAASLSSTTRCWGFRVWGVGGVLGIVCLYRRGLCNMLDMNFGEHAFHALG